MVERKVFINILQKNIFIGPKKNDSKITKMILEIKENSLFKSGAWYSSFVWEKMFINEDIEYFLVIIFIQSQ